MEDAFIGEIRIMGFNYNPIDWALCDGSLFPIQMYQPLYSIIGNLYGGSTAQQNFAVPDLRGLLAMGAGTGPGLTPRVLTTKPGAASYTLNYGTMPGHSHSVMAYAAGVGSQATPVANIPAKTSARASATAYKYIPGSPLPTMTPFNQAVIGIAGTPTPAAVSVLQPSLALNFCICLNGTYPFKPQ